MQKFSTLMTRALQKNREYIDTLSAFQSIISKANSLVEDYEKEEGITSITICPPDHGDDYLFIVIYLTEKGKIVKDVGSFIDSFITETGCEHKGKVNTNANSQTRSWEFTHKGICYKFDGDVENPRVTIKVDATKSTGCRQVETGKTVPVYKFVCDEE